MAAARTPVWRLTVLWQGTVLDAVTLRRGRQRLDLPCGAVDVDARADVVVIDGDVLDDHACVVRGGCTITVAVDRPEARAPEDWSVDSTMLHATMIGLAMQVCVLSALMMAPLNTGIDEGAGIPSDARRWLSLSGGTAARVGRPTFVPSGRKLLDGEKFESQRRRGTPPPPRTGKGPSLDQALEAMKAALHPGDNGTLKESLGQLSPATAQAPQLGAGIGGLAPRDPSDVGPGAGIIGAGTNVSLSDLLQRRVQSNDAKQPELPTKRTYPVQMEELAATVGISTIDADPELDPVVREHLTRAVRSRNNVIRGCYEAWGLAVDPKAGGRLVLELTLLPNGHVADVAVDAPPALRRVGDCVVRGASEWYLGDVVEAPTRLAFPFILQSRT